MTNFIHVERDEEVTFLRLITQKGTLELSPNHLVFVKAADGTRTSQLAETVRTRDMLPNRLTTFFALCKRNDNDILPHFLSTLWQPFDNPSTCL